MNFVFSKLDLMEVDLSKLMYVSKQMKTYLIMFNAHVGNVVMNRYKRFPVALLARLQGLRQTKESKNMMGMQKWRKDLNLSGYD